ncbi:putative metalloprotease CJM1_0395 family protein [Thalassospira australica]|uniref:putative metalloprotease CJM1_0395 family protein n=1 Tax=Thalassospira australica TaxID=1528106 RepID=UPI00051A897B|nr:putative metalloprotease CJM1_0395 family protein [Thalassospira australica]
MIAAGQTIANPKGGGLGVILNVREIAETADGRVLAEYEAIEVQQQNQNATAHSPYAVAGADSDGVRTRIVDPRTLTEAQAVAGGVSRAEYREARESNTEENNSQGGRSVGQDLDPAEEAVVNRLRARDSAVRQEEEAHAAAAGPYGSAPQYTYQIGPDGNAYAIGGHVDVSVSVSGSAADRDRALATLQNAALAPNAPSGADMAAFREASLQRATASDAETSRLTVESATNQTQSRDAIQQSISITA